jgi:hypothetical protein
MASAKGGRTERLQIMVDADELAVIDDFRFKSRMPSRAEAAECCPHPGQEDRGAWEANQRECDQGKSCALASPDFCLHECVKLGQCADCRAGPRRRWQACPG